MKKNKSQVSLSFSPILLRPSLLLQTFPRILLFSPFLSSLHPLRVFLRKTHPAPSARLFGAMRRLELWY